MKKVLIVVGTRPDAIKMAPVYLALKQRSSLEVHLLSTGQHRDLIQEALGAFGISTDYDLQAMDPQKSLAGLCTSMTNGLDQVLSEKNYDLVLGHGDTATAFAAAVASFYRKIPFYHVEAGLRSGNIHSPFPEEFHRKSITQISAHHFAPSLREFRLLSAEGIAAKDISVIGNTIHDSLRYFVHDQQNPSESRHVTITLHRRELDSTALHSIVKCLNHLAAELPGYHFVFPLHPNPHLRKIVHDALSTGSHLRLLNPLPYPEFLKLLCRSALVITDSGGVQEEAAYLGLRQLILRNESERQDGLLDSGAELIGSDPRLLIQKARALLSPNERIFTPLHKKRQIVESASEKIVQHLHRELGLVA